MFNTKSWQFILYTSVVLFYITAAEHNNHEFHFIIFHAAPALPLQQVKNHKCYVDKP